MSNRSSLMLVLCGLTVALAGLYACSGKSNPAAPGPGGGGATLNLSLNPGGGSQSFTFASAGIYPYKCGIHFMTMTGDSVIVSGSSLVDSVIVHVVGVSRPGFNPRTATVRIGGKVRWVNATGTKHTVVNQ